MPAEKPNLDEVATFDKTQLKEVQTEEKSSLPTNERKFMITALFYFNLLPITYIKV